jgi:hypothetical protein
MRRLLAVALIAAVSTSAHGADAADDDDGQTKPSSVTMSLAGTQVRMKATFRFELDGPGVALAAQMFAIPPRSVVTSGVATVDGKRHVLRLERAEAARTTFDALTLKPPGGERAWSLLIEGGAQTVTVDVLAARNANVVLELALEAPTCFHDDVRYVELPPAWTQVLTPAQQKLSTTERDVAEACSRMQGDDDDSRWVGVPARELAKQPPGEHRVGVVAGRLALDSAHFARVEIDLARELTVVPKDLATVILVDHSRSLSPAELEAQRAVVMAYVRASPPTSRIQVIGYTRRAQPLLPSWMVSSHAAPQIDRVIRALAPRNGSNVDAALTEAASWLAKTTGTKRIVLFSDARLAERIEATPDVLRGLVAADTLVHVVQPVAVGAIGLERAADDDAPLTELAKATKGITTFAALDDGGAIDATMLLRPISIDRLDVTAAGWKRSEQIFDTRDCAETLFEGDTCTWWGDGDGAAGPITITGLMWNTPLTRVVRADPSQSRTIARLLSVMSMLGVELQQQVDRAAFAVNSVWSLFATWGGRGGYEDVGGFGRTGSGSFTSGSHDSCCGIGTGRVNPPLELRAQLQPAIDRCNARETKLAVGVETTLEEIVDVSAEATPRDATLEGCIVEAVWDLTLRIPGAPPHATTHVAFGAQR